MKRNDANRQRSSRSNWAAELEHLTQIIEAKTEARLMLNEALISALPDEDFDPTDRSFAEKDYVFYIIEMLVVFEARNIYEPEGMEDFLSSLNERRRQQIASIEAEGSTATQKTRVLEIQRGLFSAPVIKRAIANALHYAGIEQKTLIRVMARHMSAPYAKQSLSLLRRADWIEWIETDFGGISTRAREPLLLAYKDYASCLVTAARDI